ncbi:LPS export ABC transporter permease LptF [Thalassotalea sp. PLHSN55]|uniref:LPS export ABC transporter permease LptF n=1 Tax=Thalassotalea sp. PLHSN55 TaxID=3435888 RepID=UPI003F865110
MIIFRYLLKEVAKTQVAVFFVLMTIFISQKFVTVLGDASEGGIPGHLVMVFIGLKIPELAGMMLPLSLFLGVLLAYGRIYADSEMTVLHACGVSEWYVVRVTLILSLVTAIITGIFTLYLAPMSAEYEVKMKEEMAADSGLSSIVAGRFQNTGNEKAVVFVQNKNREDNSLEKVFVAQLPKNRDGHQDIISASIVYAKKGLVIEEDSGSQRLILEDGIRYQSDQENEEFRSVAFAKYHIEIQEQEIKHRRRKLSAISTEQLLQEDLPENRATIQWRLSFPISCLILTLIAVPLSVVNPRQGKFAKMLPALLLFLGYFLLLTAVRSGVEGEKIPSVVGLWPIHILALFLGTSLLVKSRTSGIKLKAKLPKLPWSKS